jgi:hypothetical protein
VGMGNLSTQVLQKEMEMAGCRDPLFDICFYLFAI